MRFIVMKISCIIKVNKKLKTERTIKNGQPRKQTGYLGYTRRNIKQSKNITQYVLDTTIRKQTQITQIRQLELNTNRT
jgi:hypothetical protein